MTDEQPTDPRLPIIRRLAAALGLPIEAVAGTGDGHPPAIEVDLDPAGDRHQLVWRGGSGRTIAGMITVYSNGGTHGVRTEGAECSTWQPPITVGAPAIYEAVMDAAARLGELFDERMEAAKQGTSRILITLAEGDGDVNVTPIDADGAPVGVTSTITPARGSLAAELIAELTAKGWKESVAAAAARTVTSPDPYADASDDEHCRHGYPNCAVCHRTPGGAPNRDPGECDGSCRMETKTTPRGFPYEDHTRCDSGSPCQRGPLGAINVVQIDPEMERLRAEVAELRKPPAPASQPEAVAKLRELYNGGVGRTLTVDSDELSQVLAYVQDVEDGIMRSRVRGQDLAAARREAEQFRAKVAELNDELHIRRLSFGVAIGDAYDAHTKQQADEIKRLGTELESWKARHRDYVDASRAHTKRQDAELDEQRANGEALQQSIDQCSATHHIDWPGDE